MAETKIVSWFDAVWPALWARGTAEGFDSLSRRDRVVALVGAAFDHEIGAGHRVLFAGPVGAHTADLAESFDTIGAPKAAKVIRQFAKMFPRGAPAANEKKRARQVEKLPDKAWKVLERFGELFDEWVPGGERVLLTNLYEWYHRRRDLKETWRAIKGERGVWAPPVK